MKKTQKRKKGRFIISLDYEKFWGVCFNKNINDYTKSNLEFVDTVFFKTLELFSKYNIKATFAIVGFMFLESKNDLEKFKDFRINYSDSNLCPYRKIKLGLKPAPHTLFAGNSLKLLAESEHEVGSHTFSHFYCSQKGQTKEDFKLDLELFETINAKFPKPKTLIFPWNDVNEDYFDLISSFGYTHLRINDTESYLYNFVNNSLFKRLLRFIDRYIPLTGTNYSKTYKKNNLTLNSHSRFFAPYLKPLSFLEGLKLKRMKSEMTECAKNGKDYHLWWHPHNFGDGSKMLPQLEDILKHYQKLNKQYSFNSVRMDQL